MNKRLTAGILAGIMCVSAQVWAAEYDSKDLPENLVERIRQMDETKTEKTKSSIQSRIDEIMNADAPKVEDIKVLPKVAVIYVNNSMTDWNEDIDKKMLKCFNDLLPKEKYELVDGTPYIAKLSDLGYMDLSMVERSDFVTVMEGRGIDYCVYMEVEPMMRNGHGWHQNEEQEATVSVPVKVVDLNSGRYITAATYSEKHKDAPNFIASIFGGGVSPKNVTLRAFDAVCEKIITDVAARMPESKSAAANK